MFNSFLTLMGTPVTTTTGANVTIEASKSNRSCRGHSASNSTVLELDRSAEIGTSSSIDSPLLSPVKVNRENSMSSSDSYSSYVGSEENLSLNLKHGIDNVNLANPAFQQFAIKYLLEKIRDHEDLLIRVSNENKGLHDEIAKLYDLNDALAAENVSIQELASTNDNVKKDLQVLKDSFSSEKAKLISTNKELQNEIRAMKEAFLDESDQLRLRLTNHLKEIKNEIKTIYEDIDYLDEHWKEVQLKSCHNQIQVESLIKDSIEFLESELVRLEKNITITNQYNRRKNLVIDGIPDHIPQEELENVCLEIVHGVGFLPVGNHDVVGCHRLRKTDINSTSAPTIIRFVNRKVPEFCKRNKWRLRNLNLYNWNLSFREDLCEVTEAIFAKCEELKATGNLRKVFTYNGFVKVVKNQERPTKITHMNDVLKMFPDM